MGDSGLYPELQTEGCPTPRVLLPSALLQKILSFWPESTIFTLPWDPFLCFCLGSLQLQCDDLSELYCTLRPAQTILFCHAWEEGSWVHVCLKARAKGIHPVFGY